MAEFDIDFVSFLSPSNLSYLSVYFAQSICDDPKVLAQNYALKLNNDDYKQMDHQKALDDFMDRVKAYELVYEVSHQIGCYITIIILIIQC